MKNNIIKVLGIVIGIIILDSIQALVFDNNLLLKIRKSYNGCNLYYIDKGILVDTYYCSNIVKDTIIKVLVILVL